MGASSWSYFVPYQQDIAQALQQLREQVFASGDFVNYKAMEVEWLQSQDDDTYQEYQEKSRKAYLLRGIELPEEESRVDSIVRLEQEQTTIAGLLLHDDGSGTHSILDIYSIFDKIPDILEFHTAIPFPLEKVAAIVGTAHPTHEMIDAYENEMMLAAPGRWIGAYIIVWKDEQPDEIFFFGFSGD